MFHYLVNLCHGMDDVPMGLFQDRDEAFAFANSIGWDVPEAMIQRLQLPNCSTPCVITITTFDGQTPISRVVVRNYDDEDDDGEGSEVPQLDPSLAK